MSRTSRKEAVFYDAFEASAAKILEATELYVGFVADWEGTRHGVSRMKDVEREHDDIARAIIEELNSSFITPFDREDILALTHALDDVVDFMEDVTASFRAYDVDCVEETAGELADLTLTEARSLVGLFSAFRDFKHNKDVGACAKRIHEAEDEADDVYRSALSVLFAKRGDAIHTIKWKSLYDKMERVCDSFKVVADLAMGVVSKNA